MLTAGCRRCAMSFPWGVGRMSLAYRLGLGLVVVVSFSGSVVGAPDVDFARDIQPIFQQRCYQCHDAKKQRSGLRLDVRSRALRGGESGKPAVVPGDSGKSELVRRVSLTEGK